MYHKIRLIHHIDNWLEDVRLWHYPSNPNQHHNFQIATDEVFDSERHLIGQMVSRP